MFHPHKVFSITMTPTTTPSGRTEILKPFVEAQPLATRILQDTAALERRSGDQAAILEEHDRIEGNKRRLAAMKKTALTGAMSGIQELLSEIIMQGEVYRKAIPQQRTLDQYGMSIDEQGNLVIQTANLEAAKDALKAAKLPHRVDGDKVVIDPVAVEFMQRPMPDMIIDAHVAMCVQRTGQANRRPIYIEKATRAMYTPSHAATLSSVSAPAVGSAGRGAGAVLPMGQAVSPSR
jgi:hypothetical protein